MSRKPQDSAEDGFLHRWSRRKRSVNGDEPIVDDVIESKLDRPGEARPGEARPAGAFDELVPSNPDTPGRMITRSPGSELERAGTKGLPAEDSVLTDVDMPAMDTLDENSDYSGFLSPGVSDKLRKMALRKLFSSAGFNIRDGLDDYDDDFTQFTPLGDIVTADMKHRAEVAERRRQEAEAAAKSNIEDPEDALAAEGEQASDSVERDEVTVDAAPVGPDSQFTVTGSRGDSRPELTGASVSMEQSSRDAGDTDDSGLPENRNTEESARNKTS